MKVATVAGTQFSREQSDHRKFCPLANAKWFEQLLLGVFHRKRNSIDGGNWHSAPRAVNASAARYCESGRGSNQNVARSHSNDSYS
jgi:hypothetical protein